MASVCSEYGSKEAGPPALRPLKGSLQLNQWILLPGKVASEEVISLGNTFSNIQT